MKPLLPLRVRGLLQPAVWAAAIAAGLGIFALATEPLASNNSSGSARKALASTPPMGWNSYNSFGSSVTEAEFLANANYVSEKLRRFGYDTVVVDFRWSDATAADYDPNGIGGPLVADAFGRLMPAPNRFPSASEGRGFKPLADRVHALGLKFGIHVMRGIPRQSVAANTPIEGSRFRAADAANTDSSCSWCKDMWGVDTTKPAGQDYYDSVFRLYAEWGVDFVKVDDLTNSRTKHYHAAEVEAVARAIERSGRPMIFSVSPGETPIGQAVHVAAHANMWRISGDFWDNWKALDHMFELAGRWQEVGGPGAWPDADMLPLGRIGLRSVGGPRLTRFTQDEQLTVLSLMALMPSPLMLGMNLPENNAWTEALITNADLVAINQDILGRKGRRLQTEGATEIWAKELEGGCWAIGFFNRGDAPAEVRWLPSTGGPSGEFTAWDIWRQRDYGPVGAELSQTVPPHGTALLRLTPKGAR